MREVRFYLVYLPGAYIESSHSTLLEAEDAYKHIGRDYDEDYKVMGHQEYLDWIKA